MTQNGVPNGRFICLIGVAPLRLAEFVIFRIAPGRESRTFSNLTMDVPPNSR